MNNASVLLKKPQRPLIGKITLPGSKSITNRALLLASLAKGESRLTGALTSDDTLYMAKALRQMGVEINHPTETEFVVKGKGVLKAPEHSLFLGNAGTAMRFLVAAVTTTTGKIIVDGDAHMQKRPIGALTSALNALGVKATDVNGCPPVTVQAEGGFQEREVEVDSALSSQYVSAIMMAGACGAKPLTLSMSAARIGGRGYIDITLKIMREFGAEITELDEKSWRIEPTGYKAQSHYAIEPDASAATYLWAAEKLTSGKIDLGVDPEKLSQPDAKSYAVMAQFPNMPSEIACSQMQDSVPALAVLAAFNNTHVRFTGIENLRVKECDRVYAITTELSRVKAGLGVEDGDDLIVHSDPELKADSEITEIKTYADHRIAMSFALMGLRLDGIKILEPKVVGKTYPNFWKDLKALGVGQDFE